MLKSKQVFETISCMVRKGRANEGASLIALVGTENGRVKHPHGAFQPIDRWPSASPLLLSDLPLPLPSKDPTPTHHFMLLHGKSLHAVTADCPMSGLVLLSG